jgi:hypothetical protein
MKQFNILILLISMTACNNEQLKTEFNQIKDGLARFDVINKSSKDIRGITFEIKYIDNSNKVILVDTVSYQISNDYSDKAIFIKANDKTFIVQKIPENCKTANIKILKTIYIENDL